ncbi:hypothetical protein GTP91_06125 [Rugamonas sp. FT82W]|uniref:Thiolase C-terminal domain-containing protein n=1 Tax=Duganella vulcania TaxID=2692166 RepID=A0A845G1F7_9BURK|nr:hypothetical protein [Duganella vulcania]
MIPETPYVERSSCGGACAPGHPIGVSGARIVITLLGALRSHAVRRGEPAHWRRPSDRVGRRTPAAATLIRIGILLCY